MVTSATASWLRDDGKVKALCGTSFDFRCICKHLSFQDALESKKTHFWSLAAGSFLLCRFFYVLCFYQFLKMEIKVNMKWDL